jgi:hypothetical protein
MNDINFPVQRLLNELESNGEFTLDHWNAPIYLSGHQTVATTIELRWFHERKASLREPAGAFHMSDVSSDSKVIRMSAFARLVESAKVDESS